jgi:beta-fructofuranosidase
MKIRSSSPSDKDPANTTCRSVPEPRTSRTSPAPEVETYRGTLTAGRASGVVDVPPFAEAVVTGGPGAGEVRLVLGSGTERQVVFAGSLSEGEVLRIFIDASLVEVYRTGSVATTLRAYPATGETWRLELPEGAVADVWELMLPE